MRQISRKSLQKIPTISNLLLETTLNVKDLRIPSTPKSIDTHK